VPSEIAFVDSPAAGHREYDTGSYDAALDHFRAQMEERPSDAEPHSNAGQVLVRLGRTNEALPLLQKAADLDPARWAYRFNLARAEGLLGHWDKAAADYAEAAKLFPGDYATLFNLGQALHRAGREEEAVAQYRQAIEQNPDDSSFYLALGVSEEKLGHHAEAAAAYRHFVSMEPSARQAVAVTARATQLEAPAGPAK
jgi:tetratricopeptide (TPR) repeat protein